MVAEHVLVVSALTLGKHSSSGDQYNSNNRAWRGISLLGGFQEETGQKGLLMLGVVPGLNERSD